MAKEISIADALAALANAEGFKLTDKQREMVEAAARNEMIEAAEKVFDRKLRDEFKSTAGDFASDMFDLSERVADQVAGEKVGRGRGEVFEQMFRIETPHGSLKVSLTNAE